MTTPTIAPSLTVCQGQKKWIVGRTEVTLKCQIGMHRGGDCRMALQGVIVMFKPETT